MTHRHGTAQHTIGVAAISSLTLNGLLAAQAHYMSSSGDEPELEPASARVALARLSFSSEESSGTTA